MTRMSDQTPPSGTPAGDPQNPGGGEPTNPYQSQPEGESNRPSWSSGQQADPAQYSGYGQYGQPQYGGQQPQYGGYAGPPPDHPQSTTVLVLGIVSLVVCQILGPFAWVMGNRVVREIDAGRGSIGGRSSANAGRICGIIASVLLILTVVALVAIFAIAIVAGTSTTTTFEESGYLINP
jgi:hypothetical protein